jgi:hypothetical protein
LVLQDKVELALARQTRIRKWLLARREVASILWPELRGERSVVVETVNAQDSPTKYTKIKRGLSGFINKTRVSAVADPGSAQNIISAAYAFEKKLTIKCTFNSFQLGNSKTTNSMGMFEVRRVVDQIF